MIVFKLVAQDFISKSAGAKVYYYKIIFGQQNFRLYLKSKDGTYARMRKTSLLNKALFIRTVISRKHNLHKPYLLRSIALLCSRAGGYGASTALTKKKINSVPFSPMYEL